MREKEREGERRREKIPGGELHECGQIEDRVENKRERRREKLP